MDELVVSTDGTSVTSPVGPYQRIIALLSAMTERPGWKLSDLARKLNLPKATVLRLLKVLTDTGWIFRDADGVYRVTYRFWYTWANSYALACLRDLANRHLDTLVRETEETCFFTVVEGFHSVCLGRREGRYPVRLSLEEGARAPLHLGASNLVLLAHLPRARAEKALTFWLTEQAKKKEVVAQLERIRVQGFAYTVAQLTPGAAALAVPVMGVGSRLLGGLSVSGPAERFTWERAQEVLPLLRDHARTLGKEIEELAKQEVRDGT